MRRLYETMSKCSSCENFDMCANECLIDGSKCYENQKCLHENCPKYIEGKWTTNEDEHIPFYTDGLLQASKIVGWSDEYGES